MEAQPTPSPFTCITCRVAFADADMQRSHYKTDWHRYNLKRKVAQMPPVTAEIFFERLMSQRVHAAETNSKTGTTSYCAVCNKQFSSDSQYQNHIQSKKHKEAAAKEERKPMVEKLNKKNKDSSAASTSETCTEKEAQNLKLKTQMNDKSAQRAAALNDESSDSDDESMEDWDGDALGLEECFFCSYVSDSMETNIKHMTKSHSFFIPDLEYICDLEGLIFYLGEKIGEGHICLWCNEKSKTFLSTQAVQKHMRDKGHCKMLFEGDAVFEYSDYYDYRSSYPDYDPDSEQMETDDVSESASADDVLDGSGYELVLPSGAVVGHRTLQRYYRQKLKPERRPNSAALTRALAQYKALGWTGTSGLDAKKRAKDINMVQRMKKRHYMSLGVKANKFQPHFRPQVVF